MEKIAHKRINKDGSISVQSIKEHSVNVSELAEGFADDFDASELAGYIGILHDVGKYSDAFQRRINGSGEQVDHSSAGAKMAWNSGSFAGRLASFCIGGHHTGLPDLGTKFSDPSDATLMGQVKRNTPPIEEYMTELPVKNPEMPEWFKKGVEAALKAPTAMNQQKFFIVLDGEEAVVTAGRGPLTRVDLGIVKYNFEAASGHKCR